MATWLEVQNFVKANYQIQNETIDNLELVFNTGDNRSQLVVVHRSGKGMDLECLIFWSPFATVDQISSSQLVSVTEDLALGVGRMGKFLVVKHLAFLEDLDVSEINKAFLLVASEADDAEKRLGLGDTF
jgi:hypothetical protein